MSAINRVIEVVLRIAVLVIFVVFSFLPAGAQARSVDMETRKSDLPPQAGIY